MRSQKDISVKKIINSLEKVNQDILKYNLDEDSCSEELEVFLEKRQLFLLSQLSKYLNSKNVHTIRGLK